MNKVRCVLLAGVILLFIVLVHTIRVNAQSLIPSSGDYYAAWLDHMGHRWDLNFRRSYKTWNGWDISSSGMPQSNRCYDLGQRISYEPTREFLMGLLRAAEIEAMPQNQREDALDIAFGVLNRIFDTTSYYRDSCVNLDPSHMNGLVDGHRGWDNANFTSSMAIPGLDSIEKDVSYSLRIRVKDTLLAGAARRIHVQTWIRDVTGAPAYDEVYVPPSVNDTIEFPHGNCFLGGTMALLSGWSDVRYSNLQVFHLSNFVPPTLLYDAAARVDSFHVDWQFVRDSLTTGMTADWDLWLIDSTGAITCLAASNHRTDSERPSENGKFFGRYAALVLKADSTTRPIDSLRDLEIRCNITIMKRTIPTAESGVAIRWMNTSGGDATIGESVRNTGACVSKYFTYFRPTTAYLAVKLRPENFLQVVRHRLYNSKGDKNPNWWFAPWDEDTTSALRLGAYATDAHTYEGQICGVAAWFAQLDSVQHRGDAFVNAIEAQDGIVPKWMAIWKRNTTDWNYGCPIRGSHTFGGWQDDYVWADYLGRIGMMMGRMLHAPGATQQAFYTENFHDFAREIMDNVMIRQDTGLFAGGFVWVNERSFFQEMINYAVTGDRGYLPDLPHQGALVNFLVDAYHDGHVSLEEMRRLTKTFTKVTWNQGIYDDSITIGYYTDGRLYQSDYGGRYSSTTMSDWPLLAEFDFQTWEILDGFFNRGNNWDEYVPWTGSFHSFGRVAAEMLYTVRYGTPRNLGFSTVTTGCGSDGFSPDTAFVLNWDPPSDYPCGYERLGKRFPGSRLRYYNIYRRRPGADQWTLLDTIAIRPFQAQNVSPWYVDTSAVAGNTYEYCLRTQDWSADITNLSNPTDILTIRYPDSTRSSLPHTMNGLPEVRVPRLAWTRAVDTLSRAMYYIPEILTIPDTATLVIMPGALLTFADSMEVECRGTIVANGGGSCDSTIVFQGVNHTPGFWWGVNLYPSGHHTFVNCSFRDGVNNLVLFDPDGRVAHCDISNADDFGIQIHNAIDGQFVDTCAIHDNGIGNILISSYLDSGGDIVNIEPHIRSCTIRNAQGGDGIVCGVGSNVRIKNCVIDSSAGQGIRIEPGGETGVHIGWSTIKNSLAGIQTTNGLAKLRGNVITDNDRGIEANNGYIIGYLDSLIWGENTLENHRSNLVAKVHTYLLFGDVNNQLEPGSHNCFTLDLNSGMAEYQVWCEDSTLGTLLFNGYDPDNNQEPQLFVTGGVPIEPQAPCLSRRSTIEYSSPTEDSLKTLWFQLDTLDQSLDMRSVLERIRSALRTTNQRDEVLSLLRMMAWRSQGAYGRNMLDSLALVWIGADKVAAEVNRLPYLLVRAHWSEARRVIDYLRDSSSTSITYLDETAEYVDAHDAATRQSWLARVGLSSAAARPASWWYRYEAPRANIPPPFAKSGGPGPERRQHEDAFIIFPNPVTGNNLTISMENREESTSAVITLYTLVGRKAAQLSVDMTDGLNGITIPIYDLANGIYILTLSDGVSIRSKLMEVRR